MLLINLYGAPGSGKSTGAAYIFSKLKMNGINAELITEFAKDKVWEGSKEVFNNQAYIFGKQFFRITRCEQKVDVIITDSPLLLSLYYNKSERLGDEFKDLVRSVSDSYDSLNFFINRVKPYNNKGRFQNEEESNNISDDMKVFLYTNSVTYENINGDTSGYDFAIKKIMEVL